MPGIRPEPGGIETAGTKTRTCRDRATRPSEQGGYRCREYALSPIFAIASIFVPSNWSALRRQYDNNGHGGGSKDDSDQDGTVCSGWSANRDSIIPCSRPVLRGKIWHESLGMVPSWMVSSPSTPYLQRLGVPAARGLGRRVVGDPGRRNYLVQRLRGSRLCSSPMLRQASAVRVVVACSDGNTAMSQIRA